jgi:hypothetical protein
MSLKDKYPDLVEKHWNRKANCWWIKPHQVGPNSRKVVEWNDGSKQSIKEKIGTILFIKKAKALHGDKFDYSKVHYINTSTKVEIICPKHGAFWMRPDKHFGKHGCLKCSHEDKAWSRLEFIAKASAIYGDKYNYCRVKYVNAKSKVEIKCVKHNSTFFQAPRHHLTGREGCRQCRCLKK